MFKKKALTTAVQAAMVVSAATLMQGCNLAEEKSSSKVSGTFEQVTAPKGTVVGVVQDTNGNPLRGVEVFLGNKKTKTNAGGQYQFSNIAVQNVANLNDDTVQSGQAIVVTVLAPEGYLGATVTVEAEAQIDGMDNAQSTADGQTGNQVTTFIDGFTAAAGTAVLPELNAMVTGVLRNDETGEVVPDQTIALDLEFVGSGCDDDAQEPDGNLTGTTTSYATGNYWTTTDADGAFSLVDLPNDSDLRFVVGDYRVTGVQQNACGSDGVNTTDEVQVVNVSEVLVRPFITVDSENPYVIAVSGGIADTKVLDKGVDGTAGITLTFSEPIADTIDGEYIVEVVDTDNNAFIDLASVTMAADGRSLTFVTSSPLAEGVEIDINLARADFTDGTGNTIVAKDRINTVDPLDLDGSKDSDSDMVDEEINSGKVDWLRINVCTWIDANLDAQAVTNLVQLAEDPTGSDDRENVKAFNDAFSDTDDDSQSGDEFSGLNTDENSDAVEGRLGTLATAIATQLGGGAITYANDVALISFDPSNASTYTIDVDNTGGGLDFDSGDTIDTDTSDGYGTGNAARKSDNVMNISNNQFTVSDGATTFFALNTAEPGDTVTITPFDDLGYQGTAETLILVDNVSPTTILQRGYGEGNTLQDAVTLQDFGQGGELSEIGNTAVTGIPNLALTADLLDNQDESENGLLEDDQLKLELTDFNKDEDDDGTPELDSEIVYDFTAMQTMLANLSREIGIAMSENVVVTGAHSDNCTATLSDLTAHGDVIQDDEGAAVVVDLVNVTVDNIMTLANTDNGCVINLAGAITDEAGNTTTTASVVAQDKMGPFIIDAAYRGDELVIEFSEDIMPQENDTIRWVDGDAAVITDVAGDGNACTMTFDLSAETVQDWTDGINGNASDILVIPALNWAEFNNCSGNTEFDTEFDWDHLFDLGEYTEELAEVEHAAILAEVEDVNGNNAIDNFNGNLADLDILLFAVYNTIGEFNVSTAITGFTNGAADGTLLTLTYDSNHVIDLFDAFNATDGTIGEDEDTLNGSQTCNIVAPTGFTCDTTNSEGSLSADGETLTLTVEVSGGPLASGDELDLAADLKSSYDSGATENVDPFEVP